METLKETIRIFSQYVGINFGIDISAMLVMSRGKGETTTGIGLANQEIMRMKLLDHHFSVVKKQRESEIKRNKSPERYEFASIYIRKDIMISGSE